MSNRKPADHVIPDEVAQTASSITLSGRLFLPVPTDVARRFGWTTVPTYEQLVGKLDAALTPSSSAPGDVYGVLAGLMRRAKPYLEPSGAPGCPEMAAARAVLGRQPSSSAPEPDRQAEMLPSATLCVQYGDQQPGSSNPMPEEKRAEYQSRIVSASQRIRIYPSLKVGSSAPERPEHIRRIVAAQKPAHEMVEGSAPEQVERLEVYLNERYDESMPGTQGARDAALELLAVLDAVSGPPDQRVFRGVGELERQGYIDPVPTGPPESDERDERL